VTRVLGKSIDVIDDRSGVIGFGRPIAIEQNIKLRKISHDLAYSKRRRGKGLIQTVNLIEIG